MVESPARNPIAPIAKIIGISPMPSQARVHDLPVISSERVNVGRENTDLILKTCPQPVGPVPKTLPESKKKSRVASTGKSDDAGKDAPEWICQDGHDDLAHIFLLLTSV